MNIFVLRLGFSLDNNGGVCICLLTNWYFLTEFLILNGQVFYFINYQIDNI